MVMFTVYIQYVCMYTVHTQIHVCVCLFVCWHCVTDRREPCLSPPVVLWTLVWPEGRCAVREQCPEREGGSERVCRAEGVDRQTCSTRKHSLCIYLSDCMNVPCQKLGWFMTGEVIGFAMTQAPIYFLVCLGEALLHDKVRHGPCLSMWGVIRSDAVYVFKCSADYCVMVNTVMLKAWKELSTVYIYLTI